LIRGSAPVDCADREGDRMPALSAAGAGFLCAVLWFDLMFDVQARGGLPSEAALASISAYYRRVTTEAAPMSRLISGVMALTLASILVQILRGGGWTAWVSFAATLAAAGLAVARTVPTARRLGRAEDTVELRGQLARRLLRDHVAFLGAMALVLALQLAAAGSGS
jgi:hypothetical protein